MDLLSGDLLVILFAVGLVAGFVDSIAGGGGLLTIPVLLWCGLTPAQAIATNKLQSSFGSFSAALRFVRSGEVDPHAVAPVAACAAAGAMLGALALQVSDPEFLRDVIPLLLIGIAVYLLAFPTAGNLDQHRRIGERAFALTAGLGIGFYDGFFGPGTGTFLAIAFVTLQGFNLRKATAHTKLVNFASNIASLLLFLAGGQILWAAGLLMGVAQFIGAQAGAHMVMRDGARLVRPMLVFASLAITAKLVWSDEGNWLRGVVLWAVSPLF